jgi:hypothetical protein
MSAAPDRPPRRFPTVRVSLALLALLVVALLVWYAVMVRPWLAPPDVTDRQLAALWEAVERATNEPAPLAGPPDELRGALERIAQVSLPDLQATLDRWRTSTDLDRADRDALIAQREVGERLVRWQKAGGGLGPGDPCRVDEDVPALPAFVAGQLTLAQAEVLQGGPTREEQVLAVLRLAAALRRGGSLDHAVVGMRLAEHVAAAAKRMGALDVLREHPALAPAPVEVWRAVNIEARCLDRGLERRFGELRHGWPVPTPATRGFPRSWVVPGPEFYQRERAMLRWWWGQRLAAAAPQALDPPRLAVALRLPDDPDELPKSPLVRERAVDLTEKIEDAGRAIEAYRRVLGNTP